MAVSLNHMIVYSKDKQAAASFFTQLFDLPEAVPAGFFLAVTLEHGIMLDFAEPPNVEILPQHYAFLVTETEFDVIYSRIQDGGLEHWADPRREKANSYNTHHGGRGVYFLDPSGHYLEVITQPYGD